MPARIRFVVTPREEIADSVPGRLARKWVGNGGTATAQGEWTIADGDAAHAARVCEAVNAAFAEAKDGAGVRLDCEGATAAAEDVAAKPAVAVRDLNGSGAHGALPKLLAFPPVLSSRAKRAEASAAEEADFAGMALARATGDAAAVIESLRGLACVGAKPVALALHVAWPNPSSADDLERVRRMLCTAAAARELGARLESVAIDERGQGAGEAIAVGEFKAGGSLVSSFARGAGARLVFLGETPSEIGGSRFLEAVHGVDGGPAPLAELAAEKRLHDVLRTLISARVITAGRGVGEGGLMTAVCGMLLGGEQAWGARLDVTPLGGARADALLFGEGGSRAIVEVASDRVGTVISEAHMHGVPAALIGEVTNEGVLELKTRSLATQWVVGELRKAWGIEE